MSMFARYFFHLASDHELIRDEEGIALLADEGALFHIARAVDELINEALPSEEWQGWRLEITDGMGCLVLSIPLTVSDQKRSPLPLQ